LESIIKRNHEKYEKVIEHILRLKDDIQSIRPKTDASNENEPHWNNDFLPGLDIAALYSILEYFKPNNYIEVGSGNSTLVAKKVIRDKKLNTKITSIDPYPRAAIDQLSDRVIRNPIEDIDDLSFIWETLQSHDILFIDNSHRSLPNSDVTVCFLEILPQLKKGVIVQVHDIYIPYDYPQFMCDRFYSEQYVLSAFLLANPEKYEVVFPCYYVSENEALSTSLNPLWEHKHLKDVEKHGGSFWFRIK